MKQRQLTNEELCFLCRELGNLFSAGIGAGDAFALLAGLAALGLRAPQDLAVIGAEDVPLASLALPPLTTVRVDTRLLGERFARMALAETPDGGGDSTAPPVSAVPPAGAVPPVSLIVRASV